MICFSRENVALWLSFYAGTCRICCWTLDQALTSIQVDHASVIRPLFNENKPFRFSRDRSGRGWLVAKTDHNKVYKVRYFWESQHDVETHIRKFTRGYSEVQ